MVAGTPRSNFLTRTNQARAANGCTALHEAGDSLILSARLHSRQMAEAGDIYHSVLHLGDWSLVGEIVGVGDSWLSVWRALMGSPEHREIMLDCRYDVVALGFYRNDRLWITGRFYAH